MNNNRIVMGTRRFAISERQRRSQKMLGFGKASSKLHPFAGAWLWWVDTHPTQDAGR